ncbi:single-stranded DNA-binding protein [Bacilliculturomica massiliensis]|uniref:single-stranded DNA-binding protein n=1 Tax=Bacilliculturomica massiliensis TaxID=1917867 RepID=UPI0010309AD3|nr:single-stranded DNA-binding protein [Bacilliculturomica massiliensis]
MNSVSLVGRLTKDPEIRYTSETQHAVATFTLAVNRPLSKEKAADFPRVVVWGRQAENCERYLAKGRLVSVQGRLQTSNYKAKSGEMKYATDIVAERVDFLPGGEKHSGAEGRETEGDAQEKEDEQAGVHGGNEEELPEGFEALDDEDLPF